MRRPRRGAGRRRSRKRAPPRAPNRGRRRVSGRLRAVWRAARRVPRALSRLVPTARTRRRALRAWRRLPAGARIATPVVLLVLLWAPANWVYQVVRKPSELFFPVSGALYKTPSETWATYGPLFRRHSTDVMTPDFLAALAQVEASGNPVARTYWRWALTLEPFEIYRPASSAVGMYQITDGAFAEQRRYCIHGHRVVEDGPWHDFRSCWFNALYTRVVPSHAIEMTSAYLHQRVAEMLEQAGNPGATLRQKQALAAVIHLCGPGAAAAFVRRGLEPVPGRRCGSHDVAAYLRRVEAARAVFARLAEKESS